MTRRPRWIACAAILTAIVGPATGYSVQPMIYTLTPSGAGSSIRLSVVNSRDGLLNVEIEPYRTKADDTGKRTFAPAPDDFLIFPPQASIAADKTQAFQIRYIGSANLASGAVYVLRVRQTNTTPLTKDDAKSETQAKLALSVNFNTTAIVQPRSLTPALVVERDLAADAGGILHARLVNRGPGVADLSRVGWKLAGSGEPVTMLAEDIHYGDAVFLEPGQAREISIAPKYKGPARLIVSAEAPRDGRR